MLVYHGAKRAKVESEQEFVITTYSTKKEVVENPMEKYRELEKAILAYGDFCLKKKKKKSVEPLLPEMEPDLFLCKISQRRMEEPVTIATGEVNDTEVISFLLQTNYSTVCATWKMAVNIQKQYPIEDIHLKQRKRTDRTERTAGYTKRIFQKPITVCIF